MTETTAAPDVAWAKAPLDRQALRTTLSNFHTLSYRNTVDGFLASAKNSGTHWVKFMLSNAMAAQWGKPAPARTTGEAADDFIGPAKARRRYPELPNIGRTHTIPSALLTPAPVRALFPLKPTVVLVRDIRQAMLSNYVKWRDDYGVSLAEYVRGAPGGKRFIADVWWYVLFFNRWGDMARAGAPVLVARYEDVQADPAGQIRRMADHWKLGLDDAAIAAGAAVSGREAMRALQDPNFQEVIIPKAEVRNQVAFSAEDEAFLDAVFVRYLRHDFGYGYPGRR
ncbi:MAG TPA: sulfotransferase domain-containing protein [Caulobacteraceae bacterium]|nr:sulfotransferase domain-containing protein [Caulobacteraceae bacterium]